MLPRDFTSLEQILVASPCPANWRLMQGDAQVRHCTQCDRKVYNLSEMTRFEAMSLILRAEGHVCVRYYRRDDGKVMTRDCGRAVRRRRRLAGLASMLLTSVGLGAFWLRPTKPEAVMGSATAAAAGMLQGAVAVKPPAEPVTGKTGGGGTGAYFASTTADRSEIPFSLNASIWK